MRTCFKLSLLAVVVVSMGAAAPLCVQGTYASYQALGAGGCSIGGETFSAFSGLSFSNSLGVSALTPGQIQIIPTISGSTDSLAFSYRDTSDAPLTVSLNLANQVFAFSFTYLALATSPSSLSSVQMTSTFGNTAPGSVSTSKNIELQGGGAIFTSGVMDGGTSNAFATYKGPITPVSGTGAFVVNDAISLQAQSGSVSNSGFSNIFNLSAVTPSASAPEPAVNLMLGSGLLFVAAMLRRTANRRRQGAS